MKWEDLIKTVTLHFASKMRNGVIQGNKKRGILSESKNLSEAKGSLKFNLQLIICSLNK